MSATHPRAADATAASAQRRSSLRTWTWIHRWTSLVCTVFLLVLCISGLPLLFSDELDTWLSPRRAYADLPRDAPLASIDPMVALTRTMRPDAAIVGISFDPDKPEVRVNVAPSIEAANLDYGSIGWLAFDSRNGNFLGDSAHAAVSANRVEQFFLDLHSRFLLGDGGLILMGAMGVLFVVSLVSGTVLYAPFMRRLPFGAVRREASATKRRLDTHNMIGIVALAWMLVVGATGVLNELNDPLFSHWQRNVVARVAPDWNAAPLPSSTPLASVQAALAATRQRLSGMVVSGIDFPGVDPNGPRHYMVWAHGATPATMQIYTPVLFDAVEGRMIAALPMPWYLRAIEVSRPFHFGDYGGLPLKILWALFDVATIVVLVTGLQLWFGRGRKRCA